MLHRVGPAGALLATIAVLGASQARGQNAARFTGARNASGSPLSQPIDAAGGANRKLHPARSGRAQAIQTAMQPVQFGTANVCPNGQGTPPCSQTMTLSFSFTDNVTLGAPLALTLGAPNLDYSIVAGGSCTQGSTFVAGDTCNLQVRFAPLLPGLRLGAGELLDSNGAILSTVSVTGTGNGPQIDVDPGQLIAINCCSGLNPQSLFFPNGIAVDGSGYLYVADSVNKRIVKVSSATGQTRTVGSGLGTR